MHAWCRAAARNFWLVETRGAEGGGCCCLYVVEKYKCDSYLKTDLINVYLKSIKIHFCYKIGKFGWKYLPAIGAGAQKLHLFMFLRQKRKLINWSRVVSIGVAGEKFLNFNQSRAFQGQFFIHRVWEEFPEFSEIPTAPGYTPWLNGFEIHPNPSSMFISWHKHSIPHIRNRNWFKIPYSKTASHCSSQTRSLHFDEQFDFHLYLHAWVRKQMGDGTFLLTMSKFERLPAKLS